MWNCKDCDRIGKQLLWGGGCHWCGSSNVEKLKSRKPYNINKIITSKKGNTYEVTIVIKDYIVEIITKDKNYATTFGIPAEESDQFKVVVSELEKFIDQIDKKSTKHTESMLEEWDGVL